MARPDNQESRRTQAPPLGGMGGAEDTDYGTDIGGLGATIGADADEIASSGRWTEENADVGRGGTLGSTPAGPAAMGGGDAAGAGRLGHPSQTPTGGQTQGRQGAIRSDTGRDAMAAGSQGEGRGVPAAGGSSATGPRAGGAEQGADSGPPPARMGGEQSARGSRYGGTDSLAGGGRGAARQRTVDTLGPSEADGGDRSSEETPKGMGRVARE